MADDNRYCVFAASRLLASGPLTAVLRAAKAHSNSAHASPLLIFEERTGQQVDFDLRGSLSEVLDRAQPAAPERPGPGRPKLGVVSREVSLLPRHWQWLELEPQGISAALRRLVDEARKKNPGEQRARQAREAISKILLALAGNLPQFEEAMRALFASEHTRFGELIASWPEDLRKHALKLLTESSPAPDTPVEVP
jgi:hypothetical protein